LSTLLRLGLTSGLFPSGFNTNILYAFLFSPSCYKPRPSEPPWFDHSWVQVTKLVILINVLRQINENYIKPNLQRLLKVDLGLLLLQFE
jgi:hypothetical protein